MRKKKWLTQSCTTLGKSWNHNPILCGVLVWGSFCFKYHTTQLRCFIQPNRWQHVFNNEEINDNHKK